tara:strand:+ start:254 stop:1183 length:930 start_codon:yes stop_codon:yes gene_type:complete
MAYGKRSPLSKLKNANAIDDVKSALQNKDIKITGAMGSELRAKQYKEKGWAMDNTIGSTQGGTYKKPTVPTGKFGSDLRKTEYEANNWAGDATTKSNMPGSKSTNTNTGGGDTPQSLQSVVDSGKYKFDGNNKATLRKTAAESLAEKAGSTYKIGGTDVKLGLSKAALENGIKVASESGGSTDNFDFQDSNTNMLNATNNNNTNTSSTSTDTKKNLTAKYIKNNRKPQSTPKYSTEGKSGKQLRRANRANKYNDLAKKAFESGNTLEAQRLSLEERGVSKKIKRTASIREKRRARKLEKAQAKVNKYTK